MTEKIYNGWSNYETWAVSLWLDNERHSYEYWREQAAEHRRTAPKCQQVIDGLWAAEEAARFNLADQIKEEITAGSHLIAPTVYADLLNAAFAEVNWNEIAGHLLADAAERQEPAGDFFGPAVVFQYTRAQAIEDGVLIDVTETAREAGITFPTAVTVRLWADYIAVPERVQAQDEAGRLWDILTMFRFAAMRCHGSNPLLFELLVRNDNVAPKPVTLKAICGPGDAGEPVLTIMLPDED